MTMWTTIAPIAPVLLAVGYPVYTLIMAAVLALCGVPRQDIAKWALKQADRQRLSELIRTARGVPDAESNQQDPELYH
ncbi:hypothetical protein [Pseudonocardia humida]|uniref:Uncharacterized protein n=1 Tax=Pseudonocardia humida TaxID=2800819 RepID=A0ABT1ABX2_9PSEU|nr:hypothetical protein [Pseudonocardia humida]MCO1660525.1 hypothetical protein [Pseudonocardia humida]